MPESAPSETYLNVTRTLRLAYDRAADERDSSEATDWKVEERNRFLAMLRGEQRRTLLEVGAGSGHHGKFFRDEGLQITCTDLSEENVLRCREKGLTAEVMDFLSLEFDGRTFDAVFAMNCLLHVPRADLSAALRSIRAVLAPGGLFYLGQYGGNDSEGTYERDTYEPKRFFSFLTDECLQASAAEAFTLLDFRTIAVAIPDEDRHFQALILRRPVA